MKKSVVISVALFGKRTCKLTLNNFERYNHFCYRPYVVDKIPNTNLLFLATNDFGPCKDRSKDVYSTDPREIIYKDNISLPCYIATMNNYTRRMYMDCYKRNKKVSSLKFLTKAYRHNCKSIVSSIA